MKKNPLPFSSIFMGMALVAFSLLRVPSSFAYTVSSEELIERAKDLDGRAIVYRGEVVTGVLKRGEHSWINLNDGGNAIGVWCKTELAEGIRYAGSYRHRGDLIQVDGIFNRACGKHGGEMDIHAYRIEILREGFVRTEKVDRRTSYLAVAFFCLTLFVILRYRKRI